MPENSISEPHSPPITIKAPRVPDRDPNDPDRLATRAEISYWETELIMLIDGDAIIPEADKCLNVQRYLRCIFGRLLHTSPDRWRDESI